MTLKQMRINAGYSQKELSEISGINLRSLQDYEQGHKLISSAKGETLLKLSNVLGYSINDILNNCCGETQIELDNPLNDVESRIRLYQNALMRRKNTIVHFPIIVPDESVDMSRIYPTKQRSIKNIITALKNDSRLSSIRLFGSSINMSCNQNSDIDLAVGINELSNETRNDISEKIQIACNWDADILWLDHLSKKDRIYNDIMKGLILI